MTTPGIVGGLGPESTIDYYRDVWKRDDPGSSPSIVIDSLDVDRGIRLVEHDRPALVEYLSASLALLGTRFTMEGTFYPSVFARRGMKIVTPGAEERTWIHDRYIGQMLKGDFRDETRDGVVSVIRRLRDEEAIDGVVLGGTELTLLLTAPVVADVPALDTTALHVAAIVERLRS